MHSDKNDVWLVFRESSYKFVFTFTITLKCLTPDAGSIIGKFILSAMT